MSDCVSLLWVEALTVSLGPGDLGDLGGAGGEVGIQNLSDPLGKTHISLH